MVSHTHEGILFNCFMRHPPYSVRSSMLLPAPRLSHVATTKSRHRAGLVDGGGFSISRPCAKGQTDDSRETTNGPLMAPRHKCLPPER
jgi:hypothetical protein